MSKTALITGVTGQDGTYLARHLLELGYCVYGVVRRASLPNTARIDSLLARAQTGEIPFTLMSGDMTDSGGLHRILEKTEPDEVYNLAAQSHVRVSFDTPEYTADVDGLGPLRMLDAIRTLGFTEKTRFYQASTSELFGRVRQTPQSETTSFYPRSPYASAKLFAYWTVINYREAYGMFASNGILFNHESPLRGETFITRKVTRAAARIKRGLAEKVAVGNLDACRDWGHAADYVEGMRLILNAEKADDFVLATGETHSVRELIETAFRLAGFDLVWKGNGIDEKGLDRAGGKVLVEIDPKFFRPTEVELLCGDASKARKILGWKPKRTFRDIVEEMFRADLDALS
ncbi:MAG: GDP-mannose 4,6-dehydratase [Thermoguttaceae bacterium]|nr:GDP-mannose 4,6-dehydratase [Thermoguttaceae bacterium]